jgi:hypothetical protein
MFALPAKWSRPRQPGELLKHAAGDRPMQAHSKLVAELDRPGTDDDPLAGKRRGIEAPFRHVDV